MSRLQWALTRLRHWWNGKPLDWDRAEPPDQLDWVNDFMREVQTKYLFYDNEHDEFHPIVFCEGQLIVSGFTAETEEYQEVAFWDGEGLITINYEHVHHEYDDALKDFMKLSSKIPHDKEGIRILSFRDDGTRLGTAMSIEDQAGINRTGYAIFVRRDLLEGIYPVHEYPTGDD